MTNPSDHISHAAPGWFPDPYGSPGARWWDGQSWTQHMSDSAPPAYSSSIEPRRVSSGTPLYTPYIWFTVGLPVVWILLMFFLGSNGSRFYSAAAASMNPMAEFVGPIILLLQQTSIWLVYGLCVLFAFLDRRVLLQRGFDRPFHWAWTFFGAVVYVIGRSLVVRRRSSGGLAPMFVSLGLFLVFGIGAIVMIVLFMVALSQTVG